MLKKIANAIRALPAKIAALFKREQSVYLHLHLDAAELADHLESAVAERLKVEESKIRAFVKDEVAKAVKAAVLKAASKPAKRGK